MKVINYSFFGGLSLPESWPPLLTDVLINMPSCFMPIIGYMIGCNASMLLLLLISAFVFEALELRASYLKGVFAPCAYVGVDFVSRGVWWYLEADSSINASVILCSRMKRFVSIIEMLGKNSEPVICESDFEGFSCRYIFSAGPAARASLVPANCLL
jgi:hypothetical protein